MGLALLAAGGTMLGLDHSRRLWDRAGTLYALAEALETLRAGLEARRGLAPLCRALADREGAAGTFFQALAAGLDREPGAGTERLWNALAASHLAPLLSRREMAPFLAAGRAIHAAEGVPAALAVAAARLRELARQAEDEARRDGRLCTSLGLLGGLMAAIVLF